jgi:uncharacterized membrane protein
MIILIWLVLGVAAAVVGSLVARRVRGAGRQRAPTAEATLRRRYATGEIDRREFIERLQQLRRSEGG